MKKSAYIYDGAFSGVTLRFECEVCKRVAYLTPEEAYRQSWDMAPYSYPLSVLSPRVCPSCSLKDTAWFAVACLGIRDFNALPENHQKTILRILQEPQCLLINNDKIPFDS